MSIRALLVFIFVTATFGVVYWLIERRSINDMIGAAMVAFGWFAIAFVMFKRGRPRGDDDREW
ncbi:hypothetical protein [Burkholderia sp. Ac-20353]|uniref:hypothetical protein n=1 Tax=Burkholderia sp. Ac-20353 TaxID=2703894 RepID=UPI00197C7031|nr:hypothetical protein [Burkholderia sp. Ac-20353]MBN3786112.1 hypothetical protein [Burkholderia sp. Ac-20353]